MPGPYSFGARGFSPRPGFDLSPRKSKIVRGSAPLGDWVPWSGTSVSGPGGLARPPSLLERVVRLEWEILGSKCVGSGD